MPKLIKTLDAGVTLLVGFSFVWLYIIAFVPKSRTEEWEIIPYTIMLLVSYIVGLGVRGIYSRLKHESPQ